jgi:hypothetical protein
VDRSFRSTVSTESDGSIFAAPIFSRLEPLFLPVMRSHLSRLSRGERLAIG